MSALIASLFAVGAAPAAALDEDSKPDAAAATSACVGDATGDMMFSDVSEMHTFRGDINCLAYYGVTIGYGDGTFGPENDVTRSEMVLFMERAAGVAGADAEAVVGDFATTGSDPVNRADMALLIARLLVAANDDVANDDDGTFTVSTVADADWDYFADARGSLNRIHDSAVSALYELGVAKGTGMGYFSPAASVSRGQMAAFITRALAHTSARPAGVSIQSDGPGEVLISVRDANFHPVANAAVDVFSARADQVGEAFKADGSCNMLRVAAVGGNAMLCEIDRLDAITGLDGDYDPSGIAGHTANVKAGGTTVWAWTGESGDKVEDGGEGLASVNLTETTPDPATNAKVTTDMGDATRAHFGSTVTVTIQLVDDNDADAAPTAGEDSYTVVTRREADLNQQTDGTPADVAAGSTTATKVTTDTLKVDASGKATFTITATDPDPTDSNNADGDGTGHPNDKIDRVRVTFAVTAATNNGGPAVDDAISVTGTTTAATATITFSDAETVVSGASVKLAADYLMAPTSGSANNVVTVTVVDQYGAPIRGHLVRLSSVHAPANGPAPANVTNVSAFPVARRTDSSGSVRIGYTYTGVGSVETITVHTAADTTPAAVLTDIITGGVTEDFDWVAPVAAPVSPATGVAVNAAPLRVADVENNTVVIGATGSTPQLLVYDDNDQFVVYGSNSTMAAFEEALATALTTDSDDDNTLDDDQVEAAGYNSVDPSVVARFTLSES